MPGIGLTHGWSGNSIAASDAKEMTNGRAAKRLLAAYRADLETTGMFA
jgi:hypothetical protein